jgi:hypothetical protein
MPWYRARCELLINDPEEGSRLIHKGEEFETTFPDVMTHLGNNIEELEPRPVYWADKHLDAAIWFSLTNVTPHEAACLLTWNNPNRDDPLAKNNIETGPQDYKRLLRVFEDIAATEPQPHTLNVWHNISHLRRIKHHSWIDKYLDAENTETLSSPTDFEHTYLPLGDAAAMLAEMQYGEGLTEDVALRMLAQLNAVPGRMDAVCAVKHLAEVERQKKIDHLDKAGKLRMYSPITREPTTDRLGAMLRLSELMDLLSNFEVGGIYKSTSIESLTIRTPSEISLEARQKHDITRERGCRRLILENWDEIENLYSCSADGRQVLRVISRKLDTGDTAHKLKTVQNSLGELRKEGLIPR